MKKLRETILWIITPQSKQQRLTMGMAGFHETYAAVSINTALEILDNAATADQDTMEKILLVND